MSGIYSNMFWPPRDCFPVAFSQVTSDAVCTNVNRTSTCPDRELPYGWEVVQDPKYGIFYIDHINKRTQYEPPTEDDFALAAAVRSQLWSVGGIMPESSASLPRSVSPVLLTSVPSGDSTLVTSRSDQSSRAGRVSPTSFTADPKQIKGPLLTTTLVKSPRGFGFTVVGGVDCNRLGYLQVSDSEIPTENLICLMTITSCSASLYVRSIGK